MPVTAEEISSTLTEYLLRHSGEAGRLAPLTAELAQKGDDPAPVLRLPRHVTVNAVLPGLQKRSAAYPPPRPGPVAGPGRHCEPGDSSLADAALHELSGGDRDRGRSVQPLPEFAGRPTSMRAIPANDKKGKQGHWHYDFRFVLRTGAERQAWKN